MGTIVADRQMRPAVDAMVTEADCVAKEGSNAVAVAAVDLSAVAATVDNQEEVLAASTTTIAAQLLGTHKTIRPYVRYVTRKGIQQKSVGTGLKKTMCQIQS